MSHRFTQPISQIICRCLMAMIKLYQYSISLLLGPRCRFYPSCSNYALQVLQHHGIVKGSWYTLKRLSRCHPWHPGGIDQAPVSDKVKKS